MSTYVIKESAAKMPTSCMGVYRRIAVMEVEEGTYPAMISKRARGVIRIVRLWENLNVGKTERCAYRRAMREAEALLKHLTKEEQPG